MMELHAEVVDKKDLTRRESDVFELLCSGLQNKSISKVLGISIKTVEHHIDHIYAKLGIRWSSFNRRSAALLIAIHRGMIKAVLSVLLCVISLQSFHVSDD